MSGIRVASGHTDIYTVLNNQAQAARAETLERIIILLIAIEIVMGLLRW